MGALQVFILQRSLFCKSGISCEIIAPNVKQGQRAGLFGALPLFCAAGSG